MERFFINQRNNDAVTIGGVRSLTDFSPEQIMVGVGGAFITVAGEKLRIRRFDENEIEITGKVASVITERKR